MRCLICLDSFHETITYTAQTSNRLEEQTRNKSAVLNCRHFIYEEDAAIITGVSTTLSFWSAYKAWKRLTDVCESPSTTYDLSSSHAGAPAKLCFDVFTDISLPTSAAFRVTNKEESEVQQKDMKAAFELRTRKKRVSIEMWRFFLLDKPLTRERNSHSLAKLDAYEQWSTVPCVSMFNGRQCFVGITCLRGDLPADEETKGEEGVEEDDEACSASYLSVPYTEDRFPTGGDSDEEGKVKGKTARSTGENPVLLLCHSCMDRTRTACQSMWTHLSNGLHVDKHVALQQRLNPLENTNCTNTSRGRIKDIYP
ncbi:hypothetical protein CLF_103043 [Clonorchis sinensis]|uniref:Uncharacterized protein n=1 Tax=Clonorchis sinensis TaxID=79923 RepID=G7Y8Y6_CLOSI|nr:hypothetical protein CLF_103043 [Clonorchis sinensis]